MVTLDQIRQLDARVHRAVEMIGKLREENSTLKNRLSEYQGRIEELEVLISNFKEDQSEIEHGITSALSQLASIDDSAKEAAPGNDHRGEEARKEKPEPARQERAAEQPQGADGNGEEQDGELDIF